jgi:hypothetical protein
VTSADALGRYLLQRLIDDRGRNAKVVDWLDELTADFWKKTSYNIGDQRGAVSGFAEGVVKSLGSYREHSP